MPISSERTERPEPVSRPFTYIGSSPINVMTEFSRIWRRARSLEGLCASCRVSMGIAFPQIIAPQLAYTLKNLQGRFKGNCIHICTIRFLYAHTSETRPSVCPSRRLQFGRNVQTGMYYIQPCFRPIRRFSTALGSSDRMRSIMVARLSSMTHLVYVDNWRPMKS